MSQKMRSFSSSRKYKMLYCDIHDVFFFKQYPHICDGIMPEAVAKARASRIQGWKKKRKG